MTTYNKVPFTKKVNPDLAEYLHLLREGIFEAYTGVLQGLRADNKNEAFIPYTIMIFVGIAFVVVPCFYMAIVAFEASKEKRIWDAVR